MIYNVSIGMTITRTLMWLHNKAPVKQSTEYNSYYIVSQQCISAL